MYADNDENTPTLAAVAETLRFIHDNLELSYVALTDMDAILYAFERVHIGEALKHLNIVFNHMSVNDTTPPADCEPAAYPEQEKMP